MGTNPMGGTQAAETPAMTQGAHTRTEFIILFVWKEPTPSDLLRGQPAEGSGSPPAFGGPPPGGGFQGMGR
jgi:hypothetical protein